MHPNVVEEPEYVEVDAGDELLGGFDVQVIRVVADGEDTEGLDRGYAWLPALEARLLAYGLLQAADEIDSPSVTA